MTALTLGYQPVPLTVILTPGTEFVAALVAEGGPWPDGTAIHLELRATGTDPAPLQWPATITGDTAQWDVAAADVDTALAEGKTRVQLRYSTPDTVELLWAAGQAVSNS